MHNIKYPSYNEFKVHFKKDLIRTSGKSNLKSFIFRGQADSNWPLVSSFDRIEKDKSLYRKLLDQFRNICKTYDFQHELIKESEKDINILAAYAQHYGLPTRLLDWTKSYYFASFFAFSSAKIINLKNLECTIWAIDTESELEKKSLGLEFVKLSTNKYNYRIKNQLGHFTLSKHTEDSIDLYERNIRAKHDVDDLLWKFDVSYKWDELTEILDDLDEMGINFGVVYPDTEGYIQEAMHKTNIVK